MVKLDRIYTRGGDKGQTSLGDGKRVAKFDLRVDTYGSVEEANAAIGLARLHTKSRAAKREDAMLARIQNDLFDAGADLCRPAEKKTAKKAAKKAPLRLTPLQAKRLEREIDAMNAKMKPLASFILPGGSPASAHLHMARTIVRRAERLACALAADAPINPQVIVYLNRLSDHLFVLARFLNARGRKDVLWRPGAHR